MTGEARTRVALLGTLAELHGETAGYDLAGLRGLVTQLAPDLLCAEVTREAWERGDLEATALEVREALASVVAGTDVVLLPVAPTAQRFADFAPATGWRRGLTRSFAGWLRSGVRRAGSPEAVNGPAFGAYCHLVCSLTELAWTADDRAAWAAQNRVLVDNILAAVERDPGRRVLVAVQCQRLHRVVQHLQHYRDRIELVPYQDL